ncbi:hypothetical protein OE88DRAFT_1738935 [Heliocybe sulcata]|uniref:Uncharacterized protein n=1 Tax=Heliocybe sulcata TaxID=5364 RepID=A0A5C3MPQ0_9AGAM|nr:hypothetical protein OE88DRAFT_1738935 [Heliocybe sulcata]
MFTIVGPKYTLSAVDHQAFVTMRLGSMCQAVGAQDLRLGTQPWNIIWDNNHRPDWYLETQSVLEHYDLWASASEAEEDLKLIHNIITSDKRTFNGLGAWMGLMCWHDAASIPFSQQQL